MQSIKENNCYTPDFTNGQYGALAVGRSNLLLFIELFTPAFILDNTDFETLEDLILESGFKIETVEDISLIPQRAWDDFIADHTRFESWETMQQVAFLEWSKKTLGI